MSHRSKTTLALGSGYCKAMPPACIGTNSRSSRTLGNWSIRWLSATPEADREGAMRLPFLCKTCLTFHRRLLIRSFCLSACYLCIVLHQCPLWNCILSLLSITAISRFALVLFPCTDFTRASLLLCAREQSVILPFYLAVSSP